MCPFKLSKSFSTQGCWCTSVSCVDVFFLLHMTSDPDLDLDLDLGLKRMLWHNSDGTLTCARLQIKLLNTLLFFLRKQVSVLIIFW